MNKIIYLEWIDSEGPAEKDWLEISEISSDDHTHKCFTCGFLVKENEYYFWIADSIDPVNERCHGYMKIPKIAVTKKEVYRK